MPNGVKLDIISNIPATPVATIELQYAPIITLWPTATGIEPIPDATKVPPVAPVNTKSADKPDGVNTFVPVPVSINASIENVTFVKVPVVIVRAISTSCITPVIALSVIGRLGGNSQSNRDVVFKLTAPVALTVSVVKLLALPLPMKTAFASDKIGTPSNSTKVDEFIGNDDSVPVK